MKFSCIPFSLLLLCVTVVSVVSAQKVPPPPPFKPPVTKNKPLPKDYSHLAAPVGAPKSRSTYSPKHYYLHSVTDLTNMGDSLGFVIMPQTFEAKKLRFIVPKDSILLRYFEKHTTTDASKVPVALEINAMEVSEEKLKPGLVASKLVIRIDVVTMANGKYVTRNQYRGGGNGEFYIYSRRQYDSLIQNALEAMPEDIDAFVKEMLDRHPAFALHVVQNASLALNRHPDTLTFSENSFITLEDFRGKVLDEEDIVADFQLLLDIKEGAYKDRTVHVHTEILPVFLRKSSWIGSRLPRSAFVQYNTFKGLLFYIYAVKLQQKLNAHTFTLDNINEEIRLYYQEVRDELGETLRKYSKETLSGTKAREQKRWETFINEELQKITKVQ